MFTLLEWILAVYLKLQTSSLDLLDGSFLLLEVSFCGILLVLCPAEEIDLTMQTLKIGLYGIGILAVLDFPVILSLFAPSEWNLDERMLSYLVESFIVLLAIGIVLFCVIFIILLFVILLICLRVYLFMRAFGRV